MMLKNKKILIGVTGGIAVFRILELISLLKQEGAEIKVILTSSALKFITPLAFKSAINLCDRVYTDEDFFNQSLLHINLAKWADILVIAPITANTIAKMANGSADNLLLNCFLAFDKKVLIVPAMNPTMWVQPAVVKNVEFLKQGGVVVGGPVEGKVICGDYGIGRMINHTEIYNLVLWLLFPKPLENKNILITAGPTVEEIDSVRYITNYSSGKMGYALAQMASLLGGKVTLVSGPTSLEHPFACKVVKVKSALEMEQMCLKYAEHADFVVMAAAVSDFRPLHKSNKKLTKTDMGNRVELVTNNDILATLTSIYSKPFYVGFAIQTHDLLLNAKEKLFKKKADIIIANKISNETGFNSNTNEVYLVTKNNDVKVIPLMEKYKIALPIWVEILETFYSSLKNNIKQ